MTVPRRRVLKGMLAGGVVSALPGITFARRQTLKMVVPLTPGTTPDTIARAIADQMQQKLDMNYVVENKPGASGMIGMASVAKSDDPATLMIVPATTLTLPLFYKNVEFDVLNGFTPITQVSSTSFVLVAGKDVPASNLQEFVSWARATRNSFYASPGSGTHHHLCMELLKQSMKIPLEHVPYKGSAPAFNDLLGGAIPTMFMPIQVAEPMQRAGKLKIIGGTLRDRHPGFPAIPTLHEQGADGYHVDPWYAVWGPPKMPAVLVDQFGAAVKAALNDAGVKESLTKQGLIIKTSTPAELMSLAKEESRLWSRVVRDANISPA